MSKNSLYESYEEDRSVACVATLVPVTFHIRCVDRAMKSMAAVLVYCLIASSESFLVQKSLECREIRTRARMSTNESPRSDKEHASSTLDEIPYVVPLAATISALTSGNVQWAQAAGPENKKVAEERDDFSKSMPLPDNAYTELGGMRSCRILNGMWQVSGSHGYSPVADKVVAEMARCADSGFQTFDLADIYGPAEGYVGEFKKGPIASKLAGDCLFYTKWVTGNNPYQEITREVATEAIGKSLRRMGTDRIDLLQFHWWDYDNKQYFNAMSELMHLQQDEWIRNLGLCNFDTEHMVELIKEEAPIISNQVSFSVLDDRPLLKMIPACKKYNVQLLVYGTLLGGFLTDSWLGKPAPDPSTLTNVSLRKYLPWIRIWGGWDKFQFLLQELSTIAGKHSVSIANVATKWVLQHEQVGGVILGVRFGYTEHNKDNARVFSFKLDEEDMQRIAAAKKGTRSLFDAFGDCGGEYRRG